uniref:Uncharacterized protein n=1 Tax=viral metagenome TaxID=1070528 RepID=A0A6C0BBC9_9ZZZZ
MAYPYYRFDVFKACLEIHNTAIFLSSELLAYRKLADDLKEEMLRISALLDACNDVSESLVLMFYLTDVKKSWRELKEDYYDYHKETYDKVFKEWFGFEEIDDVTLLKVLWLEMEKKENKLAKEK